MKKKINIFLTKPSENLVHNKFSSIKYIKYCLYSEIIIYEIIFKMFSAYLGHPNTFNII